MARTIPRSAAERSNRLLLIAALLFGGVAAALVFALLINLAAGSDGGSSSAPANFVPIVVAAEDIRAGTEIKPGMLETKNLPPGSYDGAFQQPDAVVGKVTRVAVYKGDALTKVKVGESRVDQSPASAIPHGLRAVAVKVEQEQVVGGLVKKGDLVDVIVVTKNDEFDLIGAKTIMQSIQVFAVDQEYVDPAARPGDEDQPDARVSPSEGDASFDANPEAKTVTLLVTQAQAQELAAMSSIGDIVLSLRTSTDEAETPLEPFLDSVVPAPR